MVFLRFSRFISYSASATKIKRCADLSSQDCGARDMKRRHNGMLRSNTESRLSGARDRYDTSSVLD
ncbi:MAG: hypothetical protein ACON4U_04375 [Myxococcota bacterium]